jgi:hypothetical protein
MEIAKISKEILDVREAGFTTEAFNYPRTEMELRLLMAFNGHPAWDDIDPFSKVPPGWKYFPNKGMKNAWKRVAKCAADYGGTP